MHVIQQACAIPFRSVDTRLEYCLITSVKRQRWIFPKGIVEQGETPAEAALKEAWEEAGLHGSIIGQPLGRYSDRKWNTPLEVTVLMMRVLDADAHWQESHMRQRCWKEFEEAQQMLGKSELIDFLRMAQQHLGT